MNTFSFIVFMSINYILTFQVNDLLRAKTAFISYGISLIVLPMLMLAGIYLFRVAGFYANQQFQDIYFDVIFSLVVLILLNFINISANMIVRKLSQFKETENTVNIGKNPMRLVLRNKKLIKEIYRIVFFMGSILILYGLWLGEK